MIKIYHKERDLKLEQSLIELQKLPVEFIKPIEIFYTQAGMIIQNADTIYLINKK